MIATEFAGQMDRLNRMYKGSYPPEREAIIWRAVERYDVRAMEDAVTWIIGECKTAPTASEVIRAIANQNHKYTFREVQHSAADKVFCDDCFDTGYLFCRVRPTDPETLCFCHCKTGGEKEESVESVMPRWQRNINDKAYGFTKFKFPVEKFKPTNGEVSEGAIASPLSWWMKTKKEAHQWWDDQARAARGTSERGV